MRATRRRYSKSKRYSKKSFRKGTRKGRKKSKKRSLMGGSTRRPKGYQTQIRRKKESQETQTIEKKTFDKSHIPMFLPNILSQASKPAQQECHDDQWGNCSRRW